MSASNDMGGGGRRRWGNRSTERWANVLGIAALAVVVSVSLFFWWLLFNDRAMLLGIGIASTIVAVAVRIAMGARYRLRVRRQRRTAREDWPTATARKQDDRPGHSPDRER